jgi:hypothetical protein
MSDNKEQADPSAALLGVPTGDETLSRNNVDDLEVSTKQPPRPKGMSRAEYMRSGPGTDTGTHIVMAGLSPGPRIVIVLAVTALVAVAGAVVWHFVLRG